MDRRQFINLLGGIAASLPFVAHAQEPVRRVGVLSNPGPDDAEMQARIAMFVQVLEQRGWTIGRTLQIDYRLSRGDADRLRTHTAELVALGPDVVGG
jgi:putative tryptophan/tyrosine transport system substrate-binding protein